MIAFTLFVYFSFVCVFGVGQQTPPTPSIALCEDISDKNECLAINNVDNPCKWIGGIFGQCVTSGKCGIPLDAMFLMDTSVPYSFDEHSSLKEQMSNLISEYVGNKLFDTRIGIISYDRVVRTEFALSTDILAAKHVMDNSLYYPRYYASTTAVTGTAIRYGLDNLIHAPERKVANNKFLNKNPLKMLVLFSRNPIASSTRRRQICSSNVLRDILKYNIIIYVAVIGNNYRTITQIETVRCLTQVLPQHATFVKYSTNNLQNPKFNILGLQKLSNEICLPKPEN